MYSRWYPSQSCCPSLITNSRWPTSCKKTSPLCRHHEKFKTSDLMLEYKSLYRLWVSGPYIAGRRIGLSIGYKLLLMCWFLKEPFVCVSSFSYCSVSKSNALKSNALVFSCNSVVFSSWEIVFSVTASCLRRISSFEC